MDKQEFKVESRPDLSFRSAFNGALEVLSFQMTADFSDADKMSKTLSWLLERVEVCILGQWLPVKEKGRQIYNPAVLEEDVLALQEIAMQMLAIVKAVFQKSRESKPQQQ